MQELHFIPPTSTAMKRKKKLNKKRKKYIPITEIKKGGTTE